MNTQVLAMGFPVIPPPYDCGIRHIPPADLLLP